MDELKRKIETWQGKYRPKKREVESLEKDLAELEREALRGGAPVITMSPVDPRTSSGYIETGLDATLRRLRETRAALAKASQELSDIEDGARRAGVASGRLY